MDISGRNDYPSGTLSNFAPNSFTIDGVWCASMEGFLQSLKFSDVCEQMSVCLLIGIKAKKKGEHQIWQTNQVLYWQGIPYQRESPEYAKLLDRAFDALAQNPHFCQALRDTGTLPLTHTVGKQDPKETVLTEKEFITILERLRSRLST